MELQTQKIMGKVNKENVKVSTILLAICMIGISVIIAVCICMPNIWQQILMLKGELLKGIMIGLTTLPVFLFVTIKGGKDWFKKRWAWAAIGVTMVALIIIATVSLNSGATSGMGAGIMPEYPGMNMDGGGNTFVKPMG